MNFHKRPHGKTIMGGRLRELQKLIKKKAKEINVNECIYI